MLICKSDDDTSQDENESPKKKEKDKKYLWTHGSKQFNFFMVNEIFQNELLFFPIIWIKK